MSAPSLPDGDPRYYDPVEVEAYVNDVTTTVETLQARLADAVRRADEAELALGESPPETASLGRALLLAGKVAEKTIAEAEARAVEIVGAARDQAASIISAAEAEARGLVEAAHDAATDIFLVGEARLCEAVDAFVEGSTVLREALARVGEDATRWRGGTLPPNGPNRDLRPPDVPIKMSPFIPPPPIAAEGNAHFVRQEVPGKRLSTAP